MSVTRVLTERDVAALLAYEDLIPLMRRTLAAFSSGGATQPVRTTLSAARHGSRLYVMPGYLPDDGALAIKVVSAAHGNAARGLPSHLATLLLLDPESGELLAIMDARLITEMRTAAVSAAAADVLARPGARTLALVGSGVQARSHLNAIARVRPVDRVRVWSPSRERCEAFAREQSARRAIAIDAAPSAEVAVRGADMVVTVTSSVEPVVRGAWLEAGTCVLAVGAGRPEARELDGDALRRSRVFVDSRAAAELESGDVLIAQREGAIGAGHVTGEIGEVFAGRLPGRTSADEITLFKSLGQAVEDAATARHVYDRACASGTGATLRL